MFMKKLFTFLVLFLALVSQAFAERIPEQEAYKVAQQFCAAGKMMAPGRSQVAQQLQLTHSSTAYYAFNRGEGNGYVLVAADDRFSSEVLGYADEGTFDAEKMPANMKWWLSQYDSVLLAAQEGRITPQRVKLPQRSNTPKERMAPFYAGKAEISPMLTSKWGQGDPYNAKCPTYQGERCVTGCVATAMSQIMYYHQYPTKGNASHSYTWKVNGVSQKTLRSNFSTHTYKYDDMTDTYDENSSTESRDAVALLMFDAGVSVEMGYSPEASGAAIFNAAISLATYFNYDKSTVRLLRDYYEDDEWIEILYSSLAFGPILYGGQSPTNGGHAFVCDGYRNGYFHINWGWDGYQDGYFSVDPMGGFSEGQEAIINLTPATEGSDYTPLMYCAGDFVSEESSYAGYAMFSGGVSSTGERLGGFYNYGISTREMTLGIKVVNKNGTVSWIASESTADLEVGNGYSAYYVNLSKFPSAAGEYLVYPAYRDEVTGTWYEMRTRTSSDKRYLIANVSGNNITFTSPEATPEEEELAFEVVRSSDIVAGKDFSVTFNITNNAGETFSDNLRLFVLEEGTTNYYSYSDPVSVLILSGRSTEATFTATAPNASGTYDVVIADSEGHIISPRYKLNIAGDATVATLSLASLEITNADNVPIDNVEVLADITCTQGNFNGYIGFAVFTEDLQENIALVAGVFSMTENQTKSITYTGPFDKIEAGKTYFLIPVYATDVNNPSWEIMEYGKYFTVATGTGINDVTQDNVSEETSVYNLSGVRQLRVKAGTPLDTSTLKSGVYVVKSGDTTRKIIVNN